MSEDRPADRLRALERRINEWVDHEWSLREFSELTVDAGQAIKSHAVDLASLALSLAAQAGPEEDHGCRIQCPFCRRWTNHPNENKCGWCNATLIAASAPAPTPPEKGILIDRDVNLRVELRAYLDTLNRRDSSLTISAVGEWLEWVGARMPLPPAPPEEPT